MKSTAISVYLACATEVVRTVVVVGAGSTSNFSSGKAICRARIAKNIAVVSVTMNKDETNR